MTRTKSTAMRTTSEGETFRPKCAKQQQQNEDQEIEDEESDDQDDEGKGRKVYFRFV
ncbi:unnamed protein product [Linum tenue]|uniref:Uncharacterized protein n=1 Tax=Linum tenue TaxID=586396 RepID=A0AAV0R119_9ROSI|nr:unnamed protein product [Linum tenue]